MAEGILHNLTRARADARQKQRGTAIPPDKEKAESFGVRGAFVFTQPSYEMLDQIAALVDVKKIRPQVGREMNLTDAR